MSLTFGVIGLGRMGFRTVDAARRAGLRPVAILDSAATPWGLTQDASLGPLCHRTLDAFLAARPDVVAVSTTADSHAPLFAALAGAGVRRVLLEKPVACSLAEADGMIGLARERGVLVAVNHNHRAWEVLRRIRGFDGTPAFGRLCAFVITQGAGGLGNLGTHYFDLANWMFGGVAEAVAGFGTAPEAANPRGAQFDDHGGVVIARYSGARRLVLEIGDDVGAIGGYEFRYEFGRVLMPFTGEPPQVWVRQAALRGNPKHFYGTALEQVGFDGFAAADIVQNTACVLADLAAGRPSDAGASLQEARDALCLMIAARQSVETGTVQDVAEVSDRLTQVRYALA